MPSKNKASAPKVRVECPHCRSAQFESAFAQSTICRNCSEPFAILKAGEAQLPATSESFFRRIGKLVAGEKKRYDYPRWQFTNVSVDIRELCCWALDLVGVPWRQSNHKTISVSTRAGVARLDELIGLKQ